ncbi:MAG: hypothetical protein ABJX32_18045 [Tateyamaria sp.]|uniref:hypothetical protein n=1 Tax=Tateyamaria sp. TaxID=1929288 RepID=UPI00329AAE63
MSTAELKLAKLHTDLRDVATASKAIDRLLALVKQRADIAQRQRDGELRELSEALKEIAVLAFRYAPTQAPQQIANILADKPCAQALLKDLSDT